MTEGEREWTDEEVDAYLEARCHCGHPRKQHTSDDWCMDCTCAQFSEPF